MNSSAWMFLELRGPERVRQYVDTSLLRFKVVLWYRPTRRFLRRWMSR